MNTLNKLSNVIEALRKMNVVPDRIVVVDTKVETNLRVDVFYKDAHLVDRQKLKDTLNDGDAMVHVAEEVINETGGEKSVDSFNIFYAGT